MTISDESSPLAARGLVREFGPDAFVLRGVDIDTRLCESVAVTGSSGSGKTTLLNILGLLDRPDRGQVFVAGQEVDWDDQSRLRQLRGRWLGFVFQDSILDPTLTVTENVEVGLRYAGVPRGDRRERARAALDRLGLSRRAAAFPGTLSGGERQRTAIARAVAHGPKVLLCDEPTGALDATNTRVVFDYLHQERAHGLAVVVITHDLRLAGQCDRRIEIADGKAVAGPPEPLERGGRS